MLKNVLKRRHIHNLMPRTNDDDDDYDDDDRKKKKKSCFIISDKSCQLYTFLSLIDSRKYGQLYTYLYFL